MLEVLGLAHKYGFVELQNAMSEYLKKKLNILNVCLIFDVASMYCLRSLCDRCCEFMDQNAAEILQSESFLCLSLVTYFLFLVYLAFMLFTSSIWVGLVINFLIYHHYF